MATKTDATAAAKQRRQIMILAVGGVLLLGLAAFQLPKLLGGSSSESTPAPAPTTTAATGEETPAPAGSTGGTGATGSTGTPVLPTLGPGGVYVAGIPVTPARRPAAQVGQLWSISRFQWKDPFVQQVSEEGRAGAAGPETASVPTSQTPTQPPVQAQPPAPQAAPGGARSGQSGRGQAQAAPLVATISINGTPATVSLGAAFPEPDRPFLLTGLTADSATIKPRSGTFGNGKKTVTLTADTGVVLANPKTGKRYALKLLYTAASQQTVTYGAPKG